MPDLFFFCLRNIFFVFITVLFHVYDVIRVIWDTCLIMGFDYGLCIHLNVGPSGMFSEKYLEINAKNLQYNINVILAVMYIEISIS